MVDMISLKGLPVPVFAMQGVFEHNQAFEYFNHGNPPSARVGGAERLVCLNMRVRDPEDGSRN